MKIKLGDVVRSSVQEDCMQGVVLGIKQTRWFDKQLFICKIVDPETQAYAWINSWYLTKVE